MTDLEWGRDAAEKFDEGFEIIQVYDNGLNHTNEVALIRLKDGQQVVTKAMLLRPKYHQRLKSLMEIAFTHIDEQLGGPDRVALPIHARLFKPSDRYLEAFGPEDDERPRIAHLIWKFAPGIDGQTWHQQVGHDPIRSQGRDHPDAERIALLDLLVINQDRSLRNWVTTGGARFFAIDSGMAWYNQQPFYFNPEIWGCGVKCLIQDGPWKPIAGVFSTLWAGRTIRPALLQGLQNFDETAFNDRVDLTAGHLGFPEPMSGDFRFEGIRRRIRWFAHYGRLPSKDEYYTWRPVLGYGDGTPMMNAMKLLADGAKAIWRPDWEYLDARGVERVGDYDLDRAGPRTDWPY